MKNNPYSNGIGDLFPGEVIYLKGHDIKNSAFITLDNILWGGGKGKEVEVFDINDSFNDLINSLPYIDNNGLVYDGLLPEHICGFNFIYYNSPATSNHEVSDIRFRARAGRYLSGVEEDTDVVAIPVPDSGRSAASGYANQYNYKLKEGLIKAVPKRSYTIYNEKLRDELADIKYLPVQGAFHDGVNGKVVVFLDDSIVRGTTIYRLIILAFENGASKVYFKASSPPLKYFCPFGDDMKEKKDLIAIDKTLDEIYEEVFSMCNSKIIKKNYTKESERDYMLSKINKEHINIEYQTIDNLINCFDSFFVNKKQRVCLGCMTGEFPYEP
jgi:glutamine phosphoribosylpyrophosphate amidotransferase